MRVVAFTGMPGAGKSEAVAIARARGYPVERMGDFVWAETKARGLELTDANVGRIATEMRTTHGMDYWAQRTCDAILEQHARAALVVVDGVRNPEEIEAFRERFGDRFELVAILAPLDQRVNRLVKRGRSDDASTRNAVLTRDERELGLGIAASIGAADHSIANEGNLAAFRKSVGDFFDRLEAPEPRGS